MKLTESVKNVLKEAITPTRLYPNEKGLAVIKLKDYGDEHFVVFEVGKNKKGVMGVMASSINEHPEEMYDRSEFSPITDIVKILSQRYTDWTPRPWL
jgi:hypothetical protein